MQISVPVSAPMLTSKQSTSYQIGLINVHYALYVLRNGAYHSHGISNSIRILKTGFYK